MRWSTHNVILMPSRLGKYTRASGYSFMFYSIESVNFFFFCSMSKHICNMIILAIYYKQPLSVKSRHREVLGLLCLLAWSTLLPCQCAWPRQLIVGRRLVFVQQGNSYLCSGKNDLEPLTQEAVVGSDLDCAKGAQVPEWGQKHVLVRDRVALPDPEKARTARPSDIQQLVGTKVSTHLDSIKQQSV